MMQYVKNQYSRLSAYNLEVNGWLKEQLVVQKSGLTGHLEEIWPDVGENSGWLGGDGESWERGPYYLDGLVPLAYLLADADLKAKAKRWIEAILASQQPSGFFGPANNDDWWPRMVALKVLQEYHEATGDSRVISFMARYFAYQKSKIDEQPLFMWAVPRAGENVLSAFWLYEKTGDESLLELSRRLLNDQLDWASFFESLPYTQPMQAYLDWQRMKELRARYGPLEIARAEHIDEKEAADLFEKYHFSHGVNIGMAFKYPGLQYQLTGEQRYLQAIKSGMTDLQSYHGQVHGLYSCDEHLNGTEPTTGLELCTVVETMFSLETLILITGDADFADLLERVAFNALPAAISSDFTSHQYDQQVNQVLCSVAERDWYNNTETSNIFGLEPHFGCCLANMHQGWPKLSRSLWLTSSAQNNALEVTPMVYAPSVAHFASESGEFSVRELTQYPFDDSVRFEVQTGQAEQEFALRLRIPKWCVDVSLKVNGEEVTEIQRPYHSIHRVWKTGDVVRLEMKMTATINRDAATGGVYVTKGPVLYSLPVPGDWIQIVDRGVFSDYEVHPTQEWQYALMENRDAPLSVQQNEQWNGRFSDSDAPDSITVKARKVKDWEMYHNSSGPLPKDPDCSGEEKEVRLIPYGASTLRISVFPECH